MLSKFRDLLLDIKIKFPLDKNEQGFYKAHYTDRNHELRCPNCGATLWAIKNYQHIECVNCYKNYTNLGVLGLEERPATAWFE
jgi:protein-arginine kinase activator protein McsA